MKYFLENGSSFVHSALSPFFATSHCCSSISSCNGANLKIVITLLTVLPT